MIMQFDECKNREKVKKIISCSILIRLRYYQRYYTVPLNKTIFNCCSRNIPIFADQALYKVFEKIFTSLNLLFIFFSRDP